MIAYLNDRCATEDIVLLARGRIQLSEESNTYGLMSVELRGRCRNFISESLLRLVSGEWSQNGVELIER